MTEHYGDGFQGDPEKNKKNLEKHGVDFQTATKIFDRPTVDVIDRRKDYGEYRTNSIGQVEGKGYLNVTHVEREGETRIISARRASSQEVERYLELTRDLDKKREVFQTPRQSHTVADASEKSVEPQSSRPPVFDPKYAREEVTAPPQRSRVQPENARDTGTVELGKKPIERGASPFAGTQVTKEVRPFAALAGRAGRRAIQIGGFAFHGLARLFESLFSPPAPKTQEQVKHENQQTERAIRQEVAVRKHEISEAEYILRKQKWAEQTAQRDQERENFRKYLSNDRDRDR